MASYFPLQFVYFPDIEYSLPLLFTSIDLTLKITLPHTTLLLGILYQLPSIGLPFFRLFQIIVMVYFPLKLFNFVAAHLQGPIFNSSHIVYLSEVIENQELH